MHPDFQPLPDNFHYSIEPSIILEEILNIKFNPEQKKILDRKLIFEPVFEQITTCHKCGEALTFIGYKVMFGFAGYLKYCQSCETHYLEVDENY